MIARDAARDPPLLVGLCLHRPTVLRSETGVLGPARALLPLTARTPSTASAAGGGATFVMAAGTPAQDGRSFSGPRRLSGRRRRVGPGRRAGRRKDMERASAPLVRVGSHRRAAAKRHFGSRWRRRLRRPFRRGRAALARAATEVGQSLAARAEGLANAVAGRGCRPKLALSPTPPALPALEPPGQFLRRPKRPLAGPERRRQRPGRRSDPLRAHLRRTARRRPGASTAALRGPPAGRPAPGLSTGARGPQGRGAAGDVRAPAFGDGAQDVHDAAALPGSLAGTDDQLPQDHALPPIVAGRTSVSPARERQAASPNFKYRIYQGAARQCMGTGLPGSTRRTPARRSHGNSRPRSPVPSTPPTPAPRRR